MSAQNLEEFLRTAESDPTLLRELERAEDAEHLCQLARVAGYSVVPTDVLLLRRSRREALKPRTARDLPQQRTATLSA